MGDIQFRALVTEESEDKKYQCSIKRRSVNDLPAGDVLVHVKYSALNYKDALSAVGNKGVTRNYPHTPGIDAAGAVTGKYDSLSTGGPAKRNVVGRMFDQGEFATAVNREQKDIAIPPVFLGPRLIDNKAAVRRQVHSPCEGSSSGLDYAHGSVSNGNQDNLVNTSLF